MSARPITYDRHGRMQYHPDYHPNHKKDWMASDEQYLIENYAGLGPETIAAALGRTIGVIMTRAYTLRKEGKMPKHLFKTGRQKKFKRARFA